jgi:hypothetical protein
MLLGFLAQPKTAHFLRYTKPVEFTPMHYKLHGGSALANSCFGEVISVLHGKTEISIDKNSAPWYYAFTGRWLGQ